jgi:L-ribulose-5-phosphate 4-epimerase
MMLYAKERQELIDCARKMERYGLVKLSGGNVSKRVGKDMFLVTPSAMAYDTMRPEDIVLVNKEGNTVEGIRRPTSDLKAVLYIFEHMPKMQVVLHTHQPQAVAVSLVTSELPVILTSMVDELHSAVSVAPFTISSDITMGIEAVEYAGKALAVILKHHGIVAFGENMDQALSAAVYLEEACHVYLLALSTGCDIKVLTKEQIEAENTPRGYYGQP